MPKLKTHSGAKKRFRFSSKGKIKRKKAGSSHILSKKKSKRIRKLRKAGTLKSRDKRLIERLIPYR